uniref:Uncharacterized protein n=1 Tax=Echinococcus canadensis TaxID=519352 RepID=A0A915EXM8_9CEST
MPEDVISFSGLTYLQSIMSLNMYFFSISNSLINGHEATFSTTKNPEGQAVGPDTSTYPHLLSQSTIVHPISMAPQQLPRDRANSVDNHVLRSLYSVGGESSSRGISSASSTSPIHPVVPPHTPQHSPMDNTSQATTSSASSRSNGLLYSLLVSADSRPPSCRLKQPLAPSSSSTSSTSEPKKHKLEDPTQWCVAGEEFKASFKRSNELPIISLDFNSIIDRGVEPNVANSVPRTPTLPDGNTSAHSIPSSPIASTHSSSPGLSSPSSDSGLDEPLDLTPSRPPNEPMQLAKKTASPVQRNVSEFLRLAAEFVHSSNPLSMHWWDVYKATWHRLLILAIAEYRVDVVVVKSPHAFERLATGEPVLPWLNLPSDPNTLVPTREFSDRVINCINEVRNQNLAPKEYKILRNAVLFTATQPSKLAEVGAKTLQKALEAKMGCPMDNGTAGLALYSVTCALIAMETLPMAPIAGLFCGHLRGEASKDILSEKLRASIQNYSNPGESILVRLVCETPQPVSRENQAAPSAPRILTSGFTSIPPST